MRTKLLFIIFIIAIFCASSFGFSFQESKYVHQISDSAVVIDYDIMTKHNLFKGNPRPTVDAFIMSCSSDVDTVNCGYKAYAITSTEDTLMIGASATAFYKTANFKHIFQAKHLSITKKFLIKIITCEPTEANTNIRINPFQGFIQFQNNYITDFQYNTATFNMEGF